NRPRAREKNVTDGGKGVHLGGPTGMGQVGNGSAMGSGSGGQRSGGSGKLPIIAIIAMLLLGGGGVSLSSLMGGGDSANYQNTDTYETQQNAQGTNNGTGAADAGASGAQGGTGAAAGGSQSMAGSALLQALLGGNNISSTSAGWTGEDNTGKLNTSVDSEARDRYTTIRGNSEDDVTIMVYMCGTDLESRSRMATNDLTEMAKATLSDKVNVIVYTGGCKQWQNNVVSNRTNQIYQVVDGGLKCLEKDMGNKVMTDPSTLTTFIKYCGKNYPADRNMLIFWDHGGGSISGYGYDEKNPKSGSMSLAGINTALKDAGMKYDFIGFDACLMATIETDLMASEYADYLIASEETEPGVGWYYTNWLTALSKDTSMPTIEIGKNIADDFVDVCARNCYGQKTTLSIVDLAELSQTVGDEFKAFSQSTTELIKNGEYKAVSNARSNVREFAVSSKIDQIDFVSFANGLGTDEGNKLAKTLLSAVKYNRTSPNMTDSYGISVYFPYRKTSSVSKAMNTYKQIGLDDEYSDCIREFASLELSGQAATGGTSYGGSSYGGGMMSPLTVLLGGSGALTQGGSSQGSSQGASQAGSTLQTLGDITQLITALSGASGSADLFSGRSLSDEDTAQYIADNRLDPTLLTWQTDEKGKKYISLPEDQWSLVHSVDLNMYYDTGEGYVDLGLDNLYEFDEDGRLIPDVDGTWLSINGQPVAYYHTDTVDDGTDYTITGYVPALLNGERVRLVLIFNNENPYGFIAGADPHYDAEVTETVARGLTELSDGDEIRFLCDYYGYDGSFKDSYYLGDPMTVDTSDIVISNTDVKGNYKALYKFTDIYNQSYWTDEVKQ
ncbi:MAG: hypothetical protein K6G03_04195, partial [Lachnospiraceae bacterium]|nr:hypothetical protein [Lachnospiraceae bacterium]